jgi:hypothetical protein
MFNRKISNELNNDTSFDELHESAKNYCKIISQYDMNAFLRHGFNAYPVSAPFGKVYKAFKNNDPHDITKVVIKIAHKLVKFDDFDGALDILDIAQRSPLSKEQYRHNFFSHKSCLEKLKSSFAEILHKKENVEKRNEISKQIYG